MMVKKLFSQSLPNELLGDGRFLIRRKDFSPAYLATYEEGCLQDKVEEALSNLQSCKICPRNCRVNRLEGKTGTCKVGRYAWVTSAFPHHGEEDCLRGHHGSGTIFFARCNLRCVFCQNYEISQAGEGEEVTPQDLAGLMLRLQERGCHNINFVTPEHVVPQILEGLLIAIRSGLRLPIVYNTSAYDSPESIRLMEGVVDIYMPDFKLWEARNSLKYLLARDYPVFARKVIKAMHSQVGVLKADEEGIALRGVLLRHLVMPGLLEETRQIMQFLAKAISMDTYINIMDQYRPAWKAKMDEKFAEINRTITSQEMRQALTYAQQAGLWRFDTRRAFV
jgi:putative pyruvate formate lyase activating enzyme